MKWLPIVLVCALVATIDVRAGDWPMWRHDPGHSGATSDDLPETLALLWSKDLGQPRPAWPASQPWLRYDESYAPIAAGGVLFVPSMVSDSVTAYDLASGRQRWRFYADGPVRFAPIAARGRVYFGSDDGFLYCLDADQGTLRWRVRGGPYERKVLGNERLVSTWPVRGAPLLFDGKLYFSAGIWPFMGIFTSAVDPDSGRLLWTNSGEGATYTVQPHNSPAFSGFVPRGYLAASRAGLIAPGGRTQPGCYDLAGGKLRYFEFGPKNSGAFDVLAHDDWYIVCGQMIHIADNKPIVATSAQLYDDQGLYGIEQGDLVARSLRPEEEEVVEKAAPQAPSKGTKSSKSTKKKTTAAAEPDAHGAPVVATKTASTSAQPAPAPKKVRKTVLKTLWKATWPEDAPRQLLAKAGGKFLAGSDGRVAAIARIPGQERAQLAWQTKLDSDPWAVLVADRRIVVTTTGGRVYCFGERSAPAAVASPDGPGAQDTPAVKKVFQNSLPLTPSPSPARGEGSKETAAKPPAAGDRQKIIAQSGKREGYALVFGVGEGDLVEDLVRGSSLQVIALDADAQKIAALRRRMDEAGLYGTRVAATVGEPGSSALPPYLAELVVVGPSAGGSADRARAIVNTAYRVLRPYGGAAFFMGLSADALRELTKPLGLQGSVVRAAEGGAILVREGALPGAADWTHQYADAANSTCSADQGVKAPLGLLWFGGPSNDDVLPRHGHGPAPQVCGGRLIIEGSDMLRAIDIYTGRLLWQKAWPLLGKFYDFTDHQPGANAIGSNYATIADRVYVVRDSSILELDARDGSQKRKIDLPPDAGGTAHYGGFLAVTDDLLVTTTQPARYAAASPRLLVYRRADGQKLWQRDAKYVFRHNAIALGAGKIFCVDALSPDDLAALRRRGKEPSQVDPSAKPDGPPGKTKHTGKHEVAKKTEPAKKPQESKKTAEKEKPEPPPPPYVPRVLALDAQSGREVWSTGENVFGTFLNYSAEHDVLLQAGSANRDRAPDEADHGMVAYRGRDGHVVWQDLERQYTGPCILRHDTLIAQTKAYSLLTGEPKRRTDPLTGTAIPWEITRNYGCNSIIGSEHLLTFRSAAAGFYDLDGEGGTGNLGGFKSGCTSNLIVAGGLLNAPEYTRTCVCRYPNQTSLALIHDPRAEMWTFNACQWDGRPIRRVGINFGAPGDRRAESGTLWLDYPSHGGPSPDVPVEVQPQGAAYFCHHSSRIGVPQGSSALNWVAASGVQNVSCVTVTLGPEAAASRPYTIRLHFAETEGAQRGERVFGVRLQERVVAPALDIAAEAGPWSALVKEFRGVPVADKLRVSLVPQAGSRHPPVLCGIEAVSE